MFVPTCRSLYKGLNSINVSSWTFAVICMSVCVTDRGAASGPTRGPRACSIHRKQRIDHRFLRRWGRGRTSPGLKRVRVLLVGELAVGYNHGGRDVVDNVVAVEEVVVGEGRDCLAKVRVECGGDDRLHTTLELVGLGWTSWMMTFIWVFALSWMNHLYMPRATSPVGGMIGK